ncbi:hypothetical protein HanIR_Chr08g0345051 [Helianthus annuus]|nr:hypothetical protein HanIR_Chr08g0345051 [Helianthus annuus]
MLLLPITTALFSLTGMSYLCILWVCIGSLPRMAKRPANTQRVESINIFFCENHIKTFCSSNTCIVGHRYTEIHEETYYNRI